MWLCMEAKAPFKKEKITNVAREVSTNLIAKDVKLI